MPWGPSDALAHTKLATTPHLKSLWSEVANHVLADTKDDAKAIRIANGAVKEAASRTIKWV